jgi:hypothetical protein
MPRTGRPKKSADVACKCRVCGKEWTVPEWNKTQRDFCSRTCVYKSKVGVPRNDLRAKATFNLCPVCGKEFQVGGTGRPKYKQKYCSGECQAVGQTYQPKPRTMSELEVAWLAGLFDGEGSIILKKRSRPNSLSSRITITNTFYPLLERVIEVTGTGKLYEMTRYKPDPSHARSWNWQCNGSNARLVLEQLLPWLIVKKERAEIILGLRPLSEFKLLRQYYGEKELEEIEKLSE